MFKTGLTNSEEIQKQMLANGVSVGDHLKEVISKLGENIVLGRATTIEVTKPEDVLYRFSIELSI